MKRTLVCIFLVGCGGPTPPGDAMSFRDEFDSLSSAWTVSEGAVTVDNGHLVLRAGVGPAPEAKYTLPSPYRPGWDLKVSSAGIAGSPCSTIGISTGHSRRHTWVLELDPDTAQSFWGLQVGDGDGWETIGAERGGSDVLNPAIARLRVDGGDVGLWLNDVQVVDTVIEEAAPEALSIELGVSRCRIVGGVGAFDWVEIKELDP